MNKLPGKTHCSYCYNLELKYFSTVLYSTLAIFANGFNRTLWKREYLFNNNSNEAIIYSYLDEDSIEYLLDNWLCNSYETIDQIEDYPIFSPTDISQNVIFTESPYNVILSFRNTQERKTFTKYVVSRQAEFLALLGDYSFDKVENKKSCGRYNEPNYIEYLCRSGLILNQWLEKWRINKTDIK